MPVTRCGYVRMFSLLTPKNADFPLPLQWHVAMETDAQGSNIQPEGMVSSGLREPVRLGNKRRNK